MFAFTNADTAEASITATELVRLCFKHIRNELPSGRAGADLSGLTVDVVRYAS